MFVFPLPRAIHDVKATDLGLSKVRFKAEVDFDGRVVTRSYLEKQDIDQILNVSQRPTYFPYMYLLVNLFERLVIH
jgi:hypothetical protein